MIEDRLQIMHAAQHTFVQHGVTDARVADIAAAGGVSYGTFYNHFESKEVLAIVLAKRIMDERDARFLKEYTRGDKGTEETLAVLLEISVQEALLNPAWKWIFTDPAINLLDVSPGRLTYRIGRELIPQERRKDAEYVKCLYRFANAGFVDIVRGIADESLGRKADMHLLEFALKLFGASDEAARELPPRIWKGAHRRRHKSYIRSGTHCLECGFNMTMAVPSIE